MNQLSSQQFRAWVQEGKEYALIDVREDYERTAFNIGGLHIPLSEVMQQKTEIPQDKPVVFYCEKGIRSAIIIQRLETLGYKNLYNLEGGMKKWKEDITS